jgi:hypothetical protein
VADIQKILNNPAIGPADIVLGAKTVGGMFEFRKSVIHEGKADPNFWDISDTYANGAALPNFRLYGASAARAQAAEVAFSAILTGNSPSAVALSARDARTLADELRTTADFISSMKRRGPRSEFATWVKNITGQAIRLSVPLGFLEREPTIDDEDYDALIAANRTRFCGTLADTSRIIAESPGSEHDSSRSVVLRKMVAPSKTLPAPKLEIPSIKPEERQQQPEAKAIEGAEPSLSIDRAPVKNSGEGTHGSGKGGPKHRYLQSLVKELAEQHGLKAIIEAPVPGGGGQVDVMLEHNGPVAAVEISITTSARWERENVGKCLQAGIPHVVLVLSKSKRSHARYQSEVVGGLSEADRQKVTFLTPDEIPDFIASIAPPPEQTETVVKGYRVKVAEVSISPDDARARREALSKIIGRSLDRHR